MITLSTKVDIRVGNFSKYVSTKDPCRESHLLELSDSFILGLSDLYDGIGGVRFYFSLELLRCVYYLLVEDGDLTPRLNLDMSLDFDISFGIRGANPKEVDLKRLLRLVSSLSSDMSGKLSYFKHNSSFAEGGSYTISGSFDNLIEAIYYYYIVMIIPRLYTVILDSDELETVDDLKKLITSSYYRDDGIWYDAADVSSMIKCIDLMQDRSLVKLVSLTLLFISNRHVLQITGPYSAVYESSMKADPRYYLRKYGWNHYEIDAVKELCQNGDVFIPIGG